MNLHDKQEVEDVLVRFIYRLLDAGVPFDTLEEAANAEGVPRYRNSAMLAQAGDYARAIVRKQLPPVQ